MVHVQFTEGIWVGIWEEQREKNFGRNRSEVRARVVVV